MKFDKLLLRADEETLQTLFGGSSFRLLKLLDSGFATSNRKWEVLMELRSPEILLLTQFSRDILLKLLYQAEAKTLALICGLRDYSDVYQALVQVKFRRGSEKERVLFDFFELVVPQKTKALVESPSSESNLPCYSLFSHQRFAAQQVKQCLAREPNRVLLHMPTGSGKTRTAMNIIADHLRLHEPTLVVWLAYSEELCDQAATEFQRSWKYLGNRQLNLYRFWGNHNLEFDDRVRDGIVVAGLSKVYSRLKKSIQFINELGSRSSLVVIDEAHQAIAKTYKLVLDILVEPYQHSALLGLTATPGRTWADINADAELAHFFAQQKVTLEVPGYKNPIDYLVREKYLAQTNYRSLLYQSGLDLSAQDLQRIQEDLDLPQYLLNRIADDEQRNLRIILEIEDLVKRHRRILVFAISVEHATLIASVLKVRGWQAEAVTANTPSLERDRIITNFKENSSEIKIICNYGVLTTGFDAPQTSAAVIARPTRSLVLYSQMVGRAIRGVKAGGNETAEIVTVIDKDLPGFGSVAEAFTNWEDVWRQN
ncbi:DEAD/DEAH box helicase [Laspinema olomoucense]|uniref:DEAD/DEAH box helicase n=1 Tax=Laspinema olomoucense TaxID=3231600 RepID=UPI0021BA7177|nr:DEAD/DEAH box helicase [Laspinema sp. D3d]MCT7973509.1 DEAD/DEAH box helicase [Laspinema sp. D3d]